MTRGRGLSRFFSGIDGIVCSLESMVKSGGGSADCLSDFE